MIRPPRRAYRLLAVLLVAVLGGALSGCTDGLEAQRATGGYVSGDYAITVLPADEREPAPDVEGRTLEGEPLALADYAGQLVVINVWGSWCGECRTETDDLVAAEKQLRADDVAFLGIDIRDGEAAALAYAEDSGITWPSLYDQSSSQLLGLRGDMSAAATPTTYVVDEEGRLAARLLGAQTAETFVDVVEQVRDG